MISDKGIIGHETPFLHQSGASGILRSVFCQNALEIVHLIRSTTFNGVFSTAYRQEVPFLPCMHAHQIRLSCIECKFCKTKPFVLHPCKTNTLALHKMQILQNKTHLSCKIHGFCLTNTLFYDIHKSYGLLVHTTLPADNLI